MTKSGEAGVDIAVVYLVISLPATGTLLTTMPASWPSVALNSSTSFLMIGPPSRSTPGFQNSMVTGCAADMRLMLKS